MQVSNLVTMSGGGHKHNSTPGFGDQVPHKMKGSRLVVCHGQSTALEKDMQYLNIGTLGSVAEFGTLYTARGYSAATSNGRRGVTGNTSPRGDAIDYFNIGSLGNAYDWGEVSQGFSDHCPLVSDGERAFSFGSGEPESPSNAGEYVNRFNITNLGSAVDWGEMGVRRSEHAGESDGNRAIIAGGNYTPTTDEVNYTNIGTQATANDWGPNLRESKRLNQSTTDGSRILIMSGDQGPGRAAWIDAFNFGAVGGVGVDFGDMNVARSHSLASDSDGSRGVVYLGYPNISTVEYMQIGILGNAVDFTEGDVSSRYGSGACSGD